MRSETLLKTAAAADGHAAIRDNVKLIRLNRQLTQRVSVGEEYSKRFVPQASECVAALAGLEPADYRALVADRGSHAPWMWDAGLIYLKNYRERLR